MAKDETPDQEKEKTDESEYVPVPSPPAVVKKNKGGRPRKYARKSDVVEQAKEKEKQKQDDGDGDADADVTPVRKKVGRPKKNARKSEGEGEAKDKDMDKEGCQCM